MAGAALTVICLADLWQIDRRYLNDDSFTDPVERQEGFAMSTADRQILADKSYYRVANLGAGNPFNETTNATSYYHHSIGGYHAAKLHRYQDLIDRYLSAELQAFAGAANVSQGDLTRLEGSDTITPMLNMLNTKYFIFGQGTSSLAVKNPYTNGCAWFVNRLSFAANADAEIAALKGLDTKHAAVADSRFKAALDGSPLDSGSVKLTAYQPNELTYKVSSARGGVVVFSEIYYPQWTVTVDGKPAELGRANYVLRALRVPAGTHEVKMEFRPASVSATDSVAWAALVAVLLLFLAALGFNLRKKSASPAGK